MKYSLIQVDKEVNGFVSGVWVQDHTGSLDSAINKARQIEEANSNRIEIVVVERVAGSSPNYSFLAGLKRLG